MTLEEYHILYRTKNWNKLAAHRVDNAIIMAAGFSSRFLPLSHICPKSLLPVKGEVLIERQIRQLQEAGIPAIYIVVGYKKELFSYLTDKYGVFLIENTEYQTRNNNSSLYAAREYLGNSYICSSDNYFTENVFSPYEYQAFYSALYANGPTNEFCLTTDSNGKITDVVVGGRDSWYMLGHVYFDRAFSRHFIDCLEAEYDLPQTRDAYWENIYMNHLDTLAMYQKNSNSALIKEFDSLDELQEFDSYYCEHTLDEIIHHLQDNAKKSCCMVQAP